MFKTQRAYKAFDGELSSFVRNSISLVASAAVCYFAAAQSETASGDVTAELTKLIEARGLKVAQTYKYLGLARQLIADLTAEETPDPIIADMLDAKAPSTAHEKLVNWLVKEKVTSLDKLSERLGGVYARGRALQASGANQGARQGAGASTGGAGAEAGGAPKADVPETPADMLALQRELAAKVDSLDVAGDVIAIWEARFDAIEEERKATVARSRGDGHRNRSQRQAPAAHAVHG